MDESVPYSELIQRIFAENPIQNARIENFLPAIRERICTQPHLSEAKVLMPSGSGYNAIDGDLVRFRCLMQNGVQSEMYEPRFTGVLHDGTITEFTSAFFNQLDVGIFSEIHYQHCDEKNIQSRSVYKVSRLPGECSWAALRQLQQHDATTDASEKTPTEEEKTIKLYIYDDPDVVPEPKGNAIIELYGIFYSKRDITVDVDESDDIFKSNFYFKYPTIHVIQHKIIELKDLVPPPNDLFANTYEMILAFAKVLTGCDIGAQYLVSALASKTYTWVEEQPFQVCNLSFAFMNVTNNLVQSIVDCLKLLCPAVLHIKITKELLEKEAIYPVFDLDLDEVKGNNLSHAKGTVFVYDLTNYANDADTDGENYADSNINALRQLIEDEKLQYDFGLGPLNMPTDAIVIMLIPPNSRRMPITKVAVVALPINFTDGLDPAFELARLDPNTLSNFRWFLMQTREKLESIVCPREVQQAIVGKFTDIRLKFGAKAPNHLRHLMTLSRIQTALEGDQAITMELFNRMLKAEDDRLLNLCGYWLKD